MNIPIQEISAQSAPIDLTPQRVELKRYYCTFPQMFVRTSVGRMVQDSMNATRLAHVGEKFAQFVPCHMPLPVDGEPQKQCFGKYETSDPEEQAFFEAEIAKGNPDFLTEEMYKARTTDPRDVIAAQAARLAEQEARIAELQADMQQRQLKSKGKGE